MDVIEDTVNSSLVGHSDGCALNQSVTCLGDLLKDVSGGFRPDERLGILIVASQVLLDRHRMRCQQSRGDALKRSGRELDYIRMARSMPACRQQVERKGGPPESFGTARLHVDVDTQ